VIIPQKISVGSWGTNIYTVISDFRNKASASQQPEDVILKIPGKFFVSDSGTFQIQEHGTGR
jgi:hypothetical protein